MFFLNPESLIPSCRQLWSAKTTISFFVLQQICDGNGVQFFIKRFGGFLPSLSNQAVITICTLFGVADTINEFGLPFKQPCDIAKGNFIRFFSQHMAPFGSADAFDKLGFFEGADDLFKIFDGNILA